MDIRDRLSEDLTPEELEYVRTSFDIIGDIAIIKVPDKIAEHKERIADAVLAQHKNVATVLRKTQNRSGEYRTAGYEVLRGDSTETLYKEHGCRFRLDPTKTYFSERLGHERERIVDQVQDGETVIDMFAGIGPFAVMIGRLTDPAAVHAFEKNPDAVNYLRQNIRLNTVQDVVKAYEGDVREQLPATDLCGDRIIMNLPGSADAFLDVALAHLTDGGTVHLYSFEAKDDLWDTAVDRVEARFAALGAGAEVIDTAICGHYNPAVERVCFDVNVHNI